MKLKKFSLFFYHYIFLDTEKYLADSLFIKHRVRVDFGDEFAKDASPYRFIFCKIKKKDEEQFLDALNEMDNKAMLLGYHEYPKYCNIFSNIKEQLVKR